MSGWVGNLPSAQNGPTLITTSATVDNSPHPGTTLTIRSHPARRPAANRHERRRRAALDRRKLRRGR
jgi:hypothetical protein